MTDPSTYSQPKKSFIKCFFFLQDGPFVWNKQMQGHIHASFYYGYLVSQIPTSMLVQRFNGKWVFAAMYAATTLGTLVTPMAANMGYWVLIGVRVLVGVGSVSRI